MSIAQCKSQEALDNLRARDRAKKKRRTERKREERAKAVAAAKPGFSKTSAAYRQIKFGIAPEKTKSELRAELAAALRNTAAQQVPA